VKEYPDEDRPGQETFTEMSESNKKISKAVICGIVLVIFAGVNAFPSMTLKHVLCTEDTTHKYTNDVNQHFAANPALKNGLMIMGGAFSDILYLFMIGMWVAFGRSWRLPLALVFVYLTWAFMALTFRIEYPPQFLWTSPGMWSLTTPYGMNNDFHFTLHLALLMVIFNELWATRWFKLSVFSVFVLLF